MSENGTLYKEHYDYILKCTLVGDAGVGKSSILQRLLYNEMSEQYNATIGVEFGTYNYEYKNKVVKLQIWDTAGQERFKSIAMSYFRNNALAILVFDVTDRRSFANIQFWIGQVKCVNSLCHMILVGNKIDISKERVVTADEALKFANEQNIKFIEVSAKTGINVHIPFEEGTHQVIYEVESGDINISSPDCGITVIPQLKLNLNNVENSQSKCCRS